MNQQNLSARQALERGMSAAKSNYGQQAVSGGVDAAQQQLPTGHNQSTSMDNTGIYDNTYFNGHRDSADMPQQTMGSGQSGNPTSAYQNAGGAYDQDTTGANYGRQGYNSNSATGSAGSYDQSNYNDPTSTSGPGAYGANNTSSSYPSNDSHGRHHHSSHHDNEGRQHFEDQGMDNQGLRPGSNPDRFEKSGGSSGAYGSGGQAYGNAYNQTDRYGGGGMMDNPNAAGTTNNAYGSNTGATNQYANDSSYGRSGNANQYNANDGHNSGLGSQHADPNRKPSLGERIKGTAMQAIGSMTHNPEKVEEGERLKNAIPDVKGGRGF
ncbi:hypothetical protein BJ085DRAFT_31916 [Dimargaris cristalligena]|uniref:Uncharacterized protein n=1 Tax=Dimargaris cristalligena TaxID=215637 RepID=A0A4P9ZTY2_9FUNG|nr:hypothetical protein BJ085DRAFT_31916 [Dimargaris cristalligena]|eukprot:RKP36668.1 hypothetical protein BJ085DRAFT_31916 [Dimargaris cristalligena]